MLSGKKRIGHLNFSQHFSFRIKVEKHNQKIQSKIVSKIRQIFLVVNCVFDPNYIQKTFGKC